MRKLLISTSVAALCAGFAMAAGAADNSNAPAAGVQGMTQPGATSPGPATPRPADRDTTASDARGNTGQKQEGDPSGSARIGTAGGTDAERSTGTTGTTGATGTSTSSDARGNTGQKQEGDPSGSARIGTADGTDAERSTGTTGTTGATGTSTSSDARGNTGQKQEGDPSGSARIGTAGGTDAGTPAAAAAVQNGMTVVSADGNEVGTVSGVVRGPDGQVTDVVLKTKGMLLGVGSSTVAVPIERAHVNGDEVTVTMTESEIEDLPEHRG